ncbi:MAG: class I SAM-dependent methyltransferase [bacterium]|nr:class I SAM-dependent methyltransferase [bacterium]
MDQLFYDIFETLQRQGPGDNASTRRAFQQLNGLPEAPVILDVGCGVGKQTLELCRLTSGTIIALDSHAPFLRILWNQAERKAELARLHCLIADMNAMGFRDASFDAIWAEGSIFLIGFEKALQEWKALLRPGGYMAISELVWFKENPPQPVVDFLLSEVPVLYGFKDYFPIIEACGYRLVDYFPLPAESWWTDYYTPLESKIHELRNSLRNDPKAQELLTALGLEIEMHRKYSEYYGYGFYIVQRVD